MLERDTYELVCQVNGKLRDRVEAPAGADRAALEAARARRAQRPRPRRRPRDRQGHRRAGQARQRRRPPVTAPRLGVPIAVAGSGEADPPTLAAAEELGALLADAGFVVITGGLGGVMEAASRGARSKLGVTVGLLPGDDPADANGWVELALPTGLGETRNAAARPLRPRPRRGRPRLRHAVRDRLRAQVRAARRRPLLLGHRGRRARRRARARQPSESPRSFRRPSRLTRRRRAVRPWHVRALRSRHARARANVAARLRGARRGDRVLRPALAAPRRRRRARAPRAARAAAPVIERAPQPRTVVHVAGAVRRPGVYSFAAGARVRDALRRAGGAARSGDPNAINLAAKLADGQQVIVPRRAAPAACSSGGAARRSRWRRGAGRPATAGAPAAGPVSLSSATLEQLDSLDGVGPVTARKILERRAAGRARDRRRPRAGPRDRAEAARIAAPPARAVIAGAVARRCGCGCPRSPGHLLLLSAASGGLVGRPARRAGCALAAIADRASRTRRQRRAARLPAWPSLLACASFAQVRLDGARPARRRRRAAGRRAVTRRRRAARAAARRSRRLARDRRGRRRAPAAPRPRRQAALAGGSRASAPRGSLRPPGEHEAWLRPRHVALVLDARTRRARPARGAAASHGAVDASATAPRSDGRSGCRAPEAGLLRGMALGDDSALPTLGPRRAARRRARASRRGERAERRAAGAARERARRGRRRRASHAAARRPRADRSSTSRSPVAGPRSSAPPSWAARRSSRRSPRGRPRAGTRCCSPRP